MGRDCLNRIILDLQSIYIAQAPKYAPPEFGDSPEPYHLLGDGVDIGGSRFSRLRFTSLAHLPFGKDNRDEIAEIVYYVHVNTDGDRVLRRSDNLYPFPEFEESGIDPILCNRIQSMKFIYFDQDDNAYESWNSEDEEWGYATPAAVGVHIEFGDPGHPLVFGTRISLPVRRPNRQ